MTVCIAIDAMGGDHGLSVTVPAALHTLERNPSLTLILVGRKEAIQRELTKNRQRSDRLIIHHADEVVGMDESPSHAMRGKKESSMRIAINLVKEGQAEACVSAGNTGALMATARFVLKTLPGIDRPAMVTTLPRHRGHVHVLDLGANVDSSPERLLQFGVMGSILVRLIDNKPEPSVALLNIGVENIKGNDTIRQAAQLFKRSGLNYTGFIEGDGIYTGTVDVVVCDGFSGNIAVKTSEGLARMVAGILKEEFSRSLLTRIAGAISLPVLRSIRRRVDPRRYNGASLIGLEGIVTKSHGSADAVAFEHAIDEAIAEVTNQVPDHIRRELSAATQGDATIGQQPG